MSGHERIEASSDGERARAELQSLLLVVNPHASGTSPGMQAAVAARLARRYAVQTEVTRRRGHAIELAAHAVRDGVDLVAVLGGDGTINEVANGLAGSDSAAAAAGHSAQRVPALAPLPAGATNVYCRMLGVPRDVEAATARIASRAGAASLRAVDLGRAGERWFTFAAGVGLDASVVARVDAHPALKARYGPWFFASVGLGVFLRRYVRHAPSLQVRTPAASRDGVSALIQNGDVYTYFRERPIVLDELAGLRSASLGGALLTRARAGDVVPVLWRALYGGAPVHEHPRVTRIDSAQPFVVCSRDGRPLPVQVDGDHIGEHHSIEFSVAPGALRVLA